MNSDSVKVKYIECNRGGFHQGELLNIVCLNPQCKSNALCCCVCVDQLHKNHKTTTLKKLLIQSKQQAKSAQSSLNQQVKPKMQFNNDIINNLLQGSKKDTFDNLKTLCSQIRQSLQLIQEGLDEYYEHLYRAINNHQQPNPPIKIFQSVENIQGASSLAAMQSALKQLLDSIETIKKNHISHQQQLTQDTIINLISNSNREIGDFTISCLKNVEIQLQNNCNVIQKSITVSKNLFEKEMFHFSTEFKSNDIWVTDSSRVVSKKGNQYQVALMQPEINFINSVTAFRFKIIRNISNWISFGMCHKNILVEKQFGFNYINIGHGCYMISSNGGSWSHINQDLNNKVKAFNFKQGDIVTCIVNKSLREIFFIKQTPISSLSPSVTQRQIYTLPYKEDSSDHLHPCVVFYFENDEVQYLPVISLECVPRYDYLFSTVEKHPKINVIEKKIVKAVLEKNEYRAALLDRCLEENFEQPKKFFFKLKTASSWAAVGMCHSKTVISSNYGFNYQQASHGYYMISSNGGSWSSIDSSKNNVVKAFKFSQGDIIQCQVMFGQNSTDPNNKIIFRKGIQSYELCFKQIAGDKLYPCVMLYFPNDEISILPTF